MNLAHMTAGIDFFFDFVSPYSYLAHTQLPALAQRHGLHIAYRPIDLQQAKLAVGNTGPSTREMPIKHRQLRIDLQRWAAHYGVPFRPPAGYGSRRLNCGAFFAIDRGQAEAYVNTAWRLVWGEGGAMDDEALLAAAAAQMGWEAGEFLAYAGSDAAESRLRQSNEQALARGVFGVPTMALGDDMWWGNDRLHFLEQHLQARPAAAEGSTT
jgi:2-hydroxychromene-2-carboxylate isomerase